MDPTTVKAYLRRIQAPHVTTADRATLAELHLRHLETVPFENLSIHLGERIELEETSLVDKLVHRRRGGFCYELNGAFAMLLRALGFTVTHQSARVYTGDGDLGPPFDHLALRVDLDEPWLVDVGFGRGPVRPLRLDSREPQPDEDGEYRIVGVDNGDRDLYREDTPIYRIEARARELRDFVPTCWYHATCPDSHFTRNTTCSRRVPGGRVTVSGNRLIESVHEQRSETVLDSDEDVLATYRSRLGVELDRVPAVPHPR
ncbi:arylamine N-acetyltransferase [Haloechinothrix sp. YIM 98757]|uniref:Arylamine N-acetyltransferase n=1 Tax=Haloechinothrix aidingensis TaxID=2752311 RepID=A0A838AER3_9PSEU|nr:arylamine N-acetyltransferase [Haloechinothrix aidingensis]MBA0127690.1 arylamine N-acetyltransferase [Haloechinothrix aidingensis]